MAGVYARREIVKVIQQKPRSLMSRWIHRKPNEQWVEDRIGRESLEMFLRASNEHSGLDANPIPIIGTGAFAYRGDLLHAVAGGSGGSFLPKVMGALENVIRPKLIAHAAGFTSLSDLISEITVGGKSQQLFFNKVGVTGVAGRSSTLWYGSGVPGVGATAAALAAGTNYTDATAGAIPFSNAGGGDQLHLLGAEGSITVVSQNAILYDRIWAGEPATTTATAQTVTMTPTRYATTGASGTSRGNVFFAEVRATLGAATPTCTLTYVDDSGNGAEAAPTATGITAAATPTFPVGSATVAPNIFWPLNTGDYGISDITQWQHGTSWVSGNFAIVLGHPLMFIPGLAVANTGYLRDGINANINLQRIYDDACLALIEPAKGATTATTYTGMLTVAAG